MYTSFNKTKIYIGDGFVKLDDISNDVSFRLVSKEELIKIVNECPKQRFSIKYDDDQTAWIRATQGHSLACVDIDLKEIENPGDLANCIHGTYHRFWNNIRKDVCIAVFFNRQR